MGHLYDFTPSEAALHLAMYALPVLGLAVLFLLLRASRVIKRLLALRKLPGPRQSLVMGNLSAIQQAPIHHLFLKWVHEFGPVFAIRLLNSNAVVITHPETVSKLLRPGPYMGAKTPMAYRAFARLTSPPAPNILTSPTDSDYWRVTRKTTAPAFSNQNLK